MICPACEIEMIPVGGRLTCLECGYNEPLRKFSLPLFEEEEEEGPSALAAASPFQKSEKG